MGLTAIKKGDLEAQLHPYYFSCAIYTLAITHVIKMDGASGSVFKSPFEDGATHQIANWP